MAGTGIERKILDAQPVQRFPFPASRSSENRSPSGGETCLRPVQLRRRQRNSGIVRRSPAQPVRTVRFLRLRTFVGASGRSAGFRSETCSPDTDTKIHRGTHDLDFLLLAFVFRLDNFLLRVVDGTQV